jgi:hypothetical protein
LLCWPVMISVFACTGFSIIGDSNWVLEVGKVYAVSVQLYDKDNHKIYMSEVSHLSIYIYNNMDLLLALCLIPQ